jgi:hypothetical protein
MDEFLPWEKLARRHGPHCIAAIVNQLERVGRPTRPPDAVRVSGRGGRVWMTWSFLPWLTNAMSPNGALPAYYQQKTGKFIFKRFYVHKRYLVLYFDTRQVKKARWHSCEQGPQCVYPTGNPHYIGYHQTERLLSCIM